MHFSGQSLMVLSLAAVLAATKPAGGNERWATSQEGLSSMLASAYAAGTYLAAGLNGAIYTSRNGTTWTKRVDPDADSRAITGIVYGKGQFVAVGDYTPTATPVILTSPNGVTWKERKTTSEAWLTSIAFGNGRYVAVGGDYMEGGGAILTSTNGVQWTEESSNSDQPLNGIASGGGTFVAVGSNRTILTSPDGRSWTRQVEPPTVFADLQSVAHDGRQFVAVTQSEVLTSPDGATWEIASVPPISDSFFSHVASRRGVTLIVGWNVILYSPDGASWQVVLEESPGPSNGVGRTLATAVFGPNRAVALGYGGSVFTSADGQSWTSATTPASRNWNDVAYGAGKFCAVGWEGAVASSSDGAAFANHVGPSDSHFPGTVVAWGDEPGVFVALGHDSRIHTSSDCVSFEPVDRGALGFSNLLDVAYGAEDGRFVVVGRASTGPLIGSSPDGVTWTRHDAPPTTDYSYLEGVAYGEGRFVATGRGSSPGRPLLYTSEDGIEWTAQDVPFQSYESLQEIEYAGGLFIAFGHWTIWTSPDGIDWTGHPGLSNFLRDVAFGDRRFIAVGWNSTILVSTDGETWVEQATVSPRELRGIVFSEALHRFVAVGESVILRTDDPVLSFEEASYTVNEGIPTRSLIVRRSGSLAGPVSVDYGTESHTAQSPQDFTGKEGRLVLPAGRSKITITIPIRNDSLDEELEESFTVMLRNPSAGAFLGTNQGAQVFIRDNDEPGTIELARESIKVTEGNRALTVKIPLTRTGKAPLASGVTVTLATFAGTALPGEDYVEATHTVTFPAGVSRVTADVTVLPDAIDESEESFGVMLVDPSGGGQLGALTMGMVMVADNDGGGTSSSRAPLTPGRREPPEARSRHR